MLKNYIRISNEHDSEKIAAHVNNSYSSVVRAQVSRDLCISSLFSTQTQDTSGLHRNVAIDRYVVVLSTETMSFLIFYLINNFLLLNTKN